MTFGTGAGFGISVNLDVTKLSLALAYIGKETFKDEAIRRGIMRGLTKFKSAAHNHLKTLTKIRQPSRLKKGVKPLWVGNAGGGIEGRYTITDRHIRITKAYFGAQYRPYGRPGANARWGRSFSPAGAKWTSWDGTRVGKKTFMIPTAVTVFIRLKKKKKGEKGRDALMPVFGPNPAEMMKIHAQLFQGVLQQGASAELQRQVGLAYRNAEHGAKRKYGL